MTQTQTSNGNGKVQQGSAESLRPQIERALSRPVLRNAHRYGVRYRLLSLPLLWKLVGANGVIILSAVWATWFAHQRGHVQAATILAIALALSFLVNVVLVSIALRPLRGLEETAARVWQGDLAARVEDSTVADRDMERIGDILNLLLDSLTGDRARMRLLASQIIKAQDDERARISRELHDSVAQTLAASMLQIKALQSRNPQAAEPLGDVRALVADALEEVRSMSHVMYPRVLDDLGLVAALEWLARQTRETSGVSVEVENAVDDEVPHEASSVLYRVAQEALRNAVTHAQAQTVRIWISADAESATLEVVDDGKGFDVASAEARRPGMGLFAIRERVSLVDGSVEIHSVMGRGTRVTATVPLTPLRAS